MDRNMNLAVGGGRRREEGEERRHKGPFGWRSIRAGCNHLQLTKRKTQSNWESTSLWKSHFHRRKSFPNRWPSSTPSSTPSTPSSFIPSSPSLNWTELLTWIGHSNTSAPMAAPSRGRRFQKPRQSWKDPDPEGRIGQIMHAPYIT